MMDFEEFKNNVMENIRDFLPERYEGAEISLREVTKNNDQQLTGLVVQMEDSSVAPVIYLDQFYPQYQEGRGMDDILKAIADARMVNEVVEQFDTNSIIDFEQIKDKIICKLINEETNEEYLSNKPYKQIEDLAVVYAINLGSNDGGRMSTTITNDLMGQYGITAEELHDVALHNLSESVIEFKSMRDVMMEMMFPDGLPENDLSAQVFPAEGLAPMYVLTNAEKLNGAAVVLDSKTMDEIAEKLGGDYVVIPSSLHEVIIIPFTEDLNRQEIEQMIQDVNAGQVAPEDRLSDHAYQYDSLAHELVRMDKMEERQAQRAQEKKDTVLEVKSERKSERNRVSMKDKLAEKKAESAKNEVGREKLLPTQTKAAALG